MPSRCPIRLSKWLWWDFNWSSCRLEVGSPYTSVSWLLEGKTSWEWGSMTITKRLAFPALGSPPPGFLNQQPDLGWATLLPAWCPPYLSLGSDSSSLRGDGPPWHCKKVCCHKKSPLLVEVLGVWLHLIQCAILSEKHEGGGLVVFFPVCGSGTD